MVNILCENWVVGDPLSSEVDCHVVCVESCCELCLVDLLWVVSRERGFSEPGVFGVVEVDIDRYTLRIFWIETAFRCGYLCFRHDGDDLVSDYFVQTDGEYSRDWWAVCVKLAGNGGQCVYGRCRGFENLLASVEEFLYFLSGCHVGSEWGVDIFSRVVTAGFGIYFPPFGLKMEPPPSKQRTQSDSV